MNKSTCRWGFLMWAFRWWVRVFNPFMCWITNRSGVWWTFIFSLSSLKAQLNFSNSICRLIRQKEFWEKQKGFRLISDPHTQLLSATETCEVQILRPAFIPLNTQMVSKGCYRKIEVFIVIERKTSNSFLKIQSQST